jgi:hypothetical protein
VVLLDFTRPPGDGISGGWGVCGGLVGRWGGAVMLLADVTISVGRRSAFLHCYVTAAVLQPAAAVTVVTAVSATFPLSLPPPRHKKQMLRATVCSPCFSETQPCAPLLLSCCTTHGS